jgi:hypothetical protein
MMKSWFFMFFFLIKYRVPSECSLEHTRYCLPCVNGRWLQHFIHFIIGTRTRWSHSGSGSNARKSMYRYYNLYHITTQLSGTRAICLHGLVNVPSFGGFNHRSRPRISTDTSWTLGGQSNQAEWMGAYPQSATGLPVCTWRILTVLTLSIHQYLFWSLF